ncbi:MAG: RagB/SusD family nutrient uptake outer membrane protein, partial [Bacteroides sp.]|nr:RagB/SusD family nutrient uptake outer membrane protein [Bacteroides sp.]
IVSCLLLCLCLVAYNKSEFLREIPKDFMSSENSYLTEVDFNIAINDLYTFVRWEFYGFDENRPMDYVFGTDLVYDGEPGTIQRHGNMTAAYHPTSTIPRVHWDNLYKMIAGANAIHDRVDSRPFSEESKAVFKAKAAFFRGFCYRTLVYLYGGVPIITEEITHPKTDFVRATREQTLQQAITDIKFAAENLKDITQVKDGEISSSAAYHLLAELYLAAGQYKEAAEAASEVIDHPALKLMQNRFGTRAQVTPGDVYWDLFQINNQNRASGNTEGIWVIQYETNLPGGGSSTADAKTSGNYCAERNFAPFVRDVRIRQNGDFTPFRWPVSDYTGGRGIGWGISTRHYSNTIWESDFDNDIRNANHILYVNSPYTTKALSASLALTPST